MRNDALGLLSTASAMQPLLQKAVVEELRVTKAQLAHLPPMTR